VVHPTVHDEVHLPSGLLAVDDPGHVDATLTHDVPTQLDDRPGLGQVGPDLLLQQLGKVGPDDSEIEGLVAFEVGDAEPST
jgi:hypothetical protein